MINIKDFKNVQTVYVIRFGERYNEARKIEECTIKTVGRKYVTILNGGRFCKCDYQNVDYLIEDEDWGRRDILFLSEQAAKDYIEKTELDSWLYKIHNNSHKYTLEQLRKVKEILEPEEIK